MNHRLQIAAAALVALAATVPALAQEMSAPPAAAVIPEIPYKKFVLSNGLTLLVHEDHKAPIVAVNVWYHVGSKNEKARRTGFAHLFEHLMFNGSENFDDDYFKVVEPMGATDLNGTTNEDRTNYFQNVPKSALDRILWLESDRMGHLLGAIDQARLDEQRGVVQNEKRQGENEPYGKVEELVVESTYPKGHPYSWTVIGSMEDLSAASLEDVKEWFRTYYGAANAVLVIAGDVSPDEVKKKVELYFGDIPAGPPVSRHQEWIAKMTGEHRQTTQDRVPQARVYKVWNVPPTSARDTKLLSVVNNVLTGGRSSRLYKRLVYKDRIATDVRGILDDREIGSQLMIYASAQPGGDLAAVERAIDEELAELLKSGPTAEELERAKTQIRANFVRGVERIGGFGGKSDILARCQVFAGDPAAYRQWMTWILSASAADVQGAAKRWLSDGVYVLTVTPFPSFEAAKTGADRKKMPDAGAPPDAPLPPTEKSTLKNGLKVVLARRTAVPVVRVSLVLDAGFSADSPSKPGVAAMTTRMLEEGTAKRASLQIADELAALGATFSAGSSLDASTASLSTLKDKLAPALDLYADIVLNPAFPEKELERVKRNTLARIQQERVQPLGAGLRVLPGLLYGAGHPYGQPLTGSGTEESVKAMTRDDLAAFHKAWFHPNAGTLVVVGDVTMAEITPMLEKALGGWQKGAAPKKSIAAVPPRAKDDVYIVDRPGAEQSLILVGQLVPPTADPGQYAFEAFNDAFGGAFTSRINLNLREDKHWSYGSASFPVDARGQRLWFVYAPVQTDKTKESLVEVRKELKDATSSRPLTEKELKEAKDRLTLTMAGRWETAAAVGGALSEIVAYGLPEDYYATYAARIKALKGDEVSKAAQKYVTPGKQVWVVIGDRAKIEADVKALGIGEVKLLDADGKPVATAR